MSSKRFKNVDDYLEVWRDTLEERAYQAVQKLSVIPGVSGLILAGSIGRGTPWPLSDIDILAIYEQDKAEKAKKRVAAVRSELMDRWVSEGFRTSLDMGSIVFTDTEVESALRMDDTEIVELLEEPRWMHGMDKGFHGKAIYDPNGWADALIGWFGNWRYRESVISFRIGKRRSNRDTCFTQAIHWLDNPEKILEAAWAVDGAIGGTAVLMMEQWQDRGSFSRGWTFFERRAAQEGVRDVALRLAELAHLGSEKVKERMLVAPVSVQERHRLSWQARKLIGEDVTQEQDARDVLNVLSTLEFRYGEPPFGRWTGIDLVPDSLRKRLAQLRELIDQEE